MQVKSPGRGQSRGGRAGKKTETETRRPARDDEMMTDDDEKASRLASFSALSALLCSLSLLLAVASFHPLPGLKNRKKKHDK